MEASWGALTSPPASSSREGIGGRQGEDHGPIAEAEASISFVEEHPRACVLFAGEEQEALPVARTAPDPHMLYFLLEEGSTTVLD